MRKLFLSPHNDDESLFGAFTLMREKPLVLVVTDSYIQPNRGEVGCDSETRWNETKKAMELLDCNVLRLGIKDYELLQGPLVRFLSFCLSDFDVVYAPAIEENGNHHHNTVGQAAKAVYGDKVIFYTTYTTSNLYQTGDIEIKPTPEELELKNKALDCYPSQKNLPSTAPHFEAIKGKSEWLKKLS